MSKNKLYILIVTTCLSGITYFICTLFYFQSTYYPVCLIKNLTGFPCPSCGTTRSVNAIFSGNLSEALAINPFGIIVSSAMVFLPFWIGYDTITKKDSFFTFYGKIEAGVRHKKTAFLLIILAVLNWIWNINKGL